MTDPMKPKTYRDIVFPNAAMTRLVDDLVTNRLVFPANGKNGLLIYGPNGTGKSTLAGLLPDAIETTRIGRPAYAPTRHTVTTGNNGPVLIASLARVAGNIALSFGHQFFILDEVDNLGEAAMKSLKSVMEIPMTIFIMTTNNLSAIERGVRSRSHLIDMTVPPATAWLQRCRDALAAHGVQKALSDDILLPLIASCNGDAREIMTEMRKLALALA
jgi:DNA polymerase III delta prime subunit